MTANLADWLRGHGVNRGDLVGIAVVNNATAGVAVPGAVITARTESISEADREIRPRWAAWPDGGYERLIASGVRLATAWDVAAVHRLRFGGWRADPGYVWAIERGLDPKAVADAGTLFSGGDDEEEGHLDPTTRDDPERWAAQALDIAISQDKALDGRHASTARSESTAELLCAELGADGLPVNRQAMTELLESIIGPRTEAARSRAERDARVLEHAPSGVAADLRSPQQMLRLLSAAGIDVPDTRAFRLKDIDHPLVKALLDWRKAERIATTYGYTWLDEHLGADDRLRGSWTGCDGAAGRMTASAGLHNMPAFLRKAVLAEVGPVAVPAAPGQSSRGCSPRCPATARSRPRPTPTTCTCRSRRRSGSAATPPRSRSSAPCTGRPPAPARRRCAASSARTRSRWTTWTRPTSAHVPAMTCARLAGAWSG